MGGDRHTLVAMPSEIFRRESLSSRALSRTAMPWQQLATWRRQRCGSGESARSEEVVKGQRETLEGASAGDAAVLCIPLPTAMDGQR